MQYSGRLAPATSDEFRNELTACLALVVPVGMTEEGRREWLLAAWGTLKHLPADMLAAGCAKARAVADHPSKIVPAIIAETQDWYDMMRKSAVPLRSAIYNPCPPAYQLPEPERCTPEQAAEIMREFGLRANPLDKIAPHPTGGG